MKTKALSILIICLAFAGNAFAQKQLDELMKQLEQSKTASKKTSIVDNRYIWKDYLITNDPQLVAKIRDAFNKDINDAKLIVNTEGVDKSDRNYRLSFQTENGDEAIYQYNGTDNASGRFTYQLFYDKTVGEGVQKQTEEVRKIQQEQRKVLQKQREALQMQQQVLRKEQQALREGQQIAARKQREIAQEQRDAVRKQQEALREMIRNKDFSKIHSMYENATYIIPEGGYLTIDGKKMNAKEARALGYNVQTTAESEKTNKKTKPTPTFYIPKNGHITINGLKLSIEQAKVLGYDVETIAN